MIVFIDDSGDPGFSIGSSSVFVIACVIFDDELEAEKVAVTIKEYRRSLHFPDSMEFKFNKSSDKVREGFLKIVSGFSFRVRCIVVQKEKVKSTELRTNKSSFYSFFIKNVLQHNFGTINEAKIRIDGHGDREFTQKLTSYLRRELNDTKAKVVKDVKLVDSKKNVLIQLADMVAGSINRSYDQTRQDADRYRKLFSKRIEDCWEFK